MQLLSALFGCLVCSAAALGVGAPALRLLVNRDAEKRIDIGAVAMLASAFLLGQGVLAAFWLLLALVGWFTTPMIVVSLVLPILCGSWVALPWLRDAALRMRAWFFDAWCDSWYWRLIFLATLLLIVFYAMAALVVTVPSHGDGAAYYLPFGKWLLAKEQLRSFPSYEGFSQLPVFGELHFAVMMLFGVEQEARLIATPTALAGAVLLVALGARCGLGKRGQWMLLTIAWTSSTLVERLTDGKTDLFGFAMGMAAYYWVVVYRNREGTAALRLSGLFVCLAAVAKLSLTTSVLPGVALIAAWTAINTNNVKGLPGQTQSVFAAWLHLACWMFLLAGAHAIKNGLMYGEPFAPLYSFGEKPSLFGASATWQTVNWDVVLKYPLILVFGRVYGQGGNLSILLLAFAPLVLAILRPSAWKQSLLVRATVAGVLGVFFYFLAAQFAGNTQVAPRYILPTLLLFALPVARAAERVVSVEPRPRILSGLVWLTCFVVLFCAHRSSDLRRWVGHLKTHISEGHNRGEDSAIKALDEVNRLANPGDRLYMYGASRLYLRSDLLQCINSQNDQISGHDPEERWATLHKRGFSWVFIDRRLRPEAVDYLGLRNEELPPLPPYLRIERAFTSKNCLLYRLLPSEDAPPAMAKTEEVRPGVWEVLTR